MPQIDNGLIWYITTVTYITTKIPNTGASMQPKFGSHMVTRTASLQQGLGRAEPLVRVGGAGRNLPEAERFFAFAQRGEFTDLS